MMKAVVNQLKYMTRVWILWRAVLELWQDHLRVGCLMMSKKPPAAAAAFGLVSWICSGSMGLPFFLAALDSISLASSIRPLVSN